MDKIHDVLILGGGPGGYTAALYCARAGLDTLVVEKLSAGGQMALTQQIDNYPGFEEGIDGFTLGERMQQGAERFGARTLLAEAHSVELTGPVKKIHTSEGTLQARAVILATGAGARPLGLEREDEFTGRGLYYCAACDGMACRGKTAVVVGGGNTAAADALLLSRLCEKVILVHRRGTLKATKIYHEPLFKAPNLEFHWNSQVTALLGEGRLSGVETVSYTHLEHHLGGAHDKDADQQDGGNGIEHQGADAALLFHGFLSPSLQTCSPRPTPFSGSTGRWRLPVFPAGA